MDEGPHTTPPVTEGLDTRVDEVDPWSEFLSESPESGAQPDETTPVSADGDVPAVAEAASGAAEPAAEMFLSETPPAAQVETEAVQADVVATGAQGETPAVPMPVPDGTAPSLADAMSAAAADQSFDVEPGVAAVSGQVTAVEVPVDETPADERPADEAPADQAPSAGESAAALAALPPPADPPPAARPAPKPIARPDRLSLSAVLARQTPVQAREAVAAVLELCHTLRQTPDDDGRIPGLSDVLLTAEGAVEIRPGAVGEPDVRVLGRTLHALLATSTTPLPLRLFVTASISSDRFQSIELFADALSHYGPEDRTPHVQELYRRTRAMPDVPRVSIPARTRDEAPRFAGMPRSGMRVLVAASVAGVICTTAAGYWVWQMRPAADSPVEATAPDPDRVTTPVPTPVPTPADDVVAAAPPPAASAVAGWDSWRPGTIQMPPRPFAASSSATRDAVALASPDASATAPAQAAPVPAPPPAVSPVVASSAPPASPAPARVVTPDAAASAVATTAADPRIYSREDYDVEPPVLISSLVPVQPSVADPLARSTLELVIDEDGAVQSARLPNRPQTLPEMGLLSPAKMMKFRPALRNGSPVKYRLQIDVPASAL